MESWDKSNEINQVNNERSPGNFKNMRKVRKKNNTSKLEGCSIREEWGICMRPVQFMIDYGAVKTNVTKNKIIPYS